MKFTEKNGSQFNYEITILLVEDEAPIRLLMWHILNETGYRVILATDGTDGERQLKLHGASIDLLLTDLAMPGMSGVELAHRAMEMVPGIKVLYASGSQDWYPEARSDVTCLMKPFTVQELLSAVSAKVDMTDAATSVV